MGLGKPQQGANFEVASFSHCKNIMGNPKFPLAQSHTDFFLCVWFYDGPWQTQAVYSSLESALSTSYSR